MIKIRTIYIEKMDKPNIFFKKMKIENDILKIGKDLEKNKNIKKIAKILEKNEVKNVVIEKNLLENKELINMIKASNINIFDGMWLKKYLILKILNYVTEKQKIKPEEAEISICMNEITDSNIEIIKNIAKQYKRVKVVTNHIDKMRNIEKEIEEKEGILIVVNNNKLKSLIKAQIILNIDFNNELINKYKIKENSIIINCEETVKIEDMRYEGICINDYEITVGREEKIWRENNQKYREKDLLEAAIYCKDTYLNICKKIEKNKVSIKAIYGINGKI